MNAIRYFLIHHWKELVGPLSLLAITLAVGWASKRILVRALRSWAGRTRSQAPLILTQALAGTFMLWVLILAIHLAVQSSELPPGVLRYSAGALKTLWVVSFTIIATRLAGEVVRFYGSSAQGVLPLTTLTQNLAQLAVVILGLLVLLNQLDIPITPILTALGVGGLAVALALQDTLSNLFAGFYVAVAGQIRLGDYIKLNTGEEGYVTDITWRSTMMRSLSNSMIIVPNAKLAQALVTNFHLPEKRISISIPVTVAADSDPERIERVLQEVLTEAAGEVPGLLAEPAPGVAFDPGFSDLGLGFSLNCQVAEFTDQFPVRQALRRRVLRRFREEGIVLPYPTRTVYVRGQAV